MTRYKAGTATFDGWFWTEPHIVGSLDSWSTTYGWNGKSYPTRDQAIRAGLRDCGCDDFNIGHLTHGVVDWWGWMGEPHPIVDADEFAEEHGFHVALVANQSLDGTVR